LMQLCPSMYGRIFLMVFVASPVHCIGKPISVCSSMIWTLNPRFARRYALNNPAGPAPMMSILFIFRIICVSVAYLKSNVFVVHQLISTLQ